MIVLIDGNSILNRAYYALPPLNDVEGKNVNAVYGFCNILFKVLEQYKPTHLAVAFDERGKTFRHKMFDGYKAQRKGMPDDLACQLPVIKEVLNAMEIPVLAQEGVEADDIIGTISKRYDEQTLLLSGDRDLFQLIDDTTTVLLTLKGVTEVERVDAALLLEKYKLAPYQVVEFKSLRGDASDNIPGVNGIGEKTAQSLLEKYLTLDGVYQNIEEIKGSLKEKLLEGKEIAYLSKQLAQIKSDVVIDCPLEKMRVNYAFSQNLKDIFYRLQFNSLIKRLNFSEASSLNKTFSVSTVAVEDEKTLASVVQKLLGEEYLALYIGKDIKLACSNKEEYIITPREDIFGCFDFIKVLSHLKPLFESNVKKILFDGKKLKHILAEFEVSLNNVYYDIDLMAYLTEYRPLKSAEDLKDKYASENYAAILFTAAEEYLKKLEEMDMLPLYFDLELPLSNVLYGMEKVGVKVDADALNGLGKTFEGDIERLSKEIYFLAGEAFNILSPKQLAVILFEKLKLPRSKKTKTGYSTDNEVLEDLADRHPIIPLLIEMRQISKLKGTYVDGMKAHISTGNIIHTKYNQTLTSTGRLSSSEPNLQNIPIRDDAGKEIRKVFVSRYGTLVSADYSQIELRLLAAFSKDPSMVAAFNNDEDIHRKVAADIFAVPSELVTDKMRRMAKVVNFGIIYGMSDFGLSSDLGISISDARNYINNFFSSHAEVEKYLSDAVTWAEEKGYALSMTGRRRFIPELKSTNFNLKKFGRRAAMNMPLQASAADIIKKAMLGVDKELKAQNLKSKMIMQIHDELVIDCYEEEKEKVKALLKTQMESAANLLVKLTVSVGEGKNLYDAK